MKLALTGGIAEGKSTVAADIRAAGYEVASADEIAREVFLLGEVQERLGQMLRLKPPVPKEAVRESIFNKPDLRKELDRITHPIILARMRESEAPVLEVPLLFETCIQGLFERIWVATCGEEEQLRRLSERLGSEAQARRMIQAQLPTVCKCAFADRIVRTNALPDTVRSYVFEAIRRDL